MNYNITETLIIVVSVLLSVAFFTLAERNLIAVNHNRKGPNKTSLNGILQPISDAIKLLTNEWNNINTSNKIIYAASPSIGLASYTIMWVIVPNSSSAAKINISILFLVAVLATTIIFSISAGWSSNSNFTILGSYRSTAQAISYEVSIAIFILAIILLTNSLNTVNVNETTITTKMLLLPIVATWALVILAETSRTPFDFTESESELVSGFNTEYYGALFSIFFIAEYMALIFISTLTAIVVTSGNTIIIASIATIILIIITITRITLPRSRYDKLMSLAWLTVIPISVVTLSSIMVL